MTPAAPAPAPTAAPDADVALEALVGKARAVAHRAAKLRYDVQGAHRLVTLAQQREAVTRTELTQALTAALADRARVRMQLRRQALAAFVAGARVRRFRRHNRVSRLLDRLLGRLGSFGQGAVIARSGVWRGTGRALFDYRHMAAYARRRANPDVQPPALFDQAWRLRHSPDLAAAGIAPLVHFLLAGAAEGRSPHPLFDEAWYAAGHPEAAAHGISGLEHYVRAGAARGLSPHPLFDPAHYLAQGPALAPGEDPLSHYIREGALQGLSPHPLFDPAWYAGQAAAAGAPLAGGVNPLVHYLEGGSAAGLKPHPLFDPDWYRDRNPDLAERGVEPLIHFVTEGWTLGKHPGPWFDLNHYAIQRGDARPADLNPLLDYLDGGAWAVAESRDGLPTAAYIAAHPDLAAQGLTPLEHWARRLGR